MKGEPCFLGSDIAQVHDITTTTHDSLLLHVWVDHPVEPHQDNGTSGDCSTIDCQYGDRNGMLAHQWSVQEYGH